MIPVIHKTALISLSGTNIIIRTKGKKNSVRQRSYKIGRGILMDKSFMHHTGSGVHFVSVSLRSRDLLCRLFWILHRPFHLFRAHLRQLPGHSAVLCYHLDRPDCNWPENCFCISLPLSNSLTRLIWHLICCVSFFFIFLSFRELVFVLQGHWWNVTYRDH